jgi:hypothetical protein
MMQETQSRKALHLLVNRDFEIQTPLQHISTRLLFIDFQLRLHYFHAVQCMPKAKVWHKTWAEYDIQKALDYANDFQEYDKGHQIYQQS